MNRQISLMVLTALVSVSSMAQTELMMKKFRFRKHSSANFERLVLEFSGPAVSEEVEMKTNKVGSEKDVSLVVKNAQLVGAVPESTINESLEGSRKWIGPLSINTDMPKNGFSLRTLLKNSEAQVDAFWLSQPTRLVVDVFPSGSPRAHSRNPMEAHREVASTAEKAKATPKTSEPIFCFPSNAKMSASVAYFPWKGSSAIPLEVKDPSAAQNEMKEGIVCYPAQSRVHPRVNFTTGEVEPSQPVASVAPQLNNKPEAPTLSSNEAPLLPTMEIKVEPRVIASEAPAKAPQFDPRAQNGLPPSLGASFDKPQKGANPASLLPPYR
ncbi:MAG: hypothetical protein EBQ92_04975 [Proteobacteria bacterium]|nr:hypothetical protein [Pseudomonadota bacterium]